MGIVYVKLIGCDGVAEICGQLEEGVMVLHRSMLSWRRGGISLLWVFYM